MAMEQSMLLSATRGTSFAPEKEDEHDNTVTAHESSLLPVQSQNHRVSVSLSTKKHPNELFWSIMACKSPTLKLCRDIDENVIYLLEVSYDFSSWLSLVMNEKLLPLSHLARLSTMIAKLSRSKSDVSELVSSLLHQVRSMLLGFDSTNPDMLEREMLLVRNDRSLILEEKIEKLAVELDFTKQNSKVTGILRSWERFILLVIRELEETRGDETRKMICDFAATVKGRDKMNVGQLQAEVQKLGDKAKIKMLIKKQMAQLEKQEQNILKREEKLSNQQLKNREALDEWDGQRDAEWQAIARERGDLQRSAQQLMSERQQIHQAKEELEAARGKMNEQWRLAAQELSERESMVNARFPELSEVESYVSDLLRKLDANSRKFLDGLMRSEEMKEIVEETMNALRYAEYESRNHENKSKETLKQSGMSGFVTEKAARKHSEEQLEAALEEDLPIDADGLPVDTADLIESKNIEIDHKPENNSATVELDAQGTSPGLTEASSENVVPGDTSVPLILSDHSLPSEPVLGDLTLEEPGKFQLTLPNISETTPSFLLDMLQRIVQEPDFHYISEEDAPTMTLVRKIDNLALKLRLVEARENECTIMEEKYRVMEEKVQAYHVRTVKAEEESEISSKIAAQAKEKICETDKLKAEYDALIKDTQESRLEVQKQERLLEDERTFFNELVTRSLGYKDGVADLKRLMSLESREREVSKLQTERAAVLEQERLQAAEQLKLDEERTSLERKAEALHELSQKLEQALQIAGSEQKEFEESAAARASALQEKEREIAQRWTVLELEFDRESRRQHLAELVLRQADQEQIMRQREEKLAQLEADLNHERVALPKKVQQLVEEGTAQARAELRKQQEDLKLREKAHTAAIESFHAEKSQWGNIARAARLLKDADVKNKQAEERLAFVQVREQEISNLAAELAREKETLRRAQVTSTEMKDEFVKAKFDFDLKMRELLTKESDLLQRENNLSIQIQQFERMELAPSDEVNALQSLLDQKAKELNNREIELKRKEGILNAQSVLAKASSLDTSENAGWDAEIKDATREADNGRSERNGSLEEKNAMLQPPLDHIEKLDGWPTKSREHDSGLTRTNMKRATKQTSDEFERKGKADPAIEIERMKREYEVTKKQLNQKQDQLLSSLRDLEKQESHLNILLDAEKVVKEDMPKLHAGSEPGVDSVSTNLSQEKIFVEMKELTIKHLLALQEVYRAKISIVDNEVRQRKRRGVGTHDAHSSLPRQAVSAIQSRIQREMEAQASAENDFLIRSILSVVDEDNGYSRGDHADVRLAAVISPQPFHDPHGNTHPASMGALPAIYLPSIGQAKAAAAPRRLGGGFAVGAGVGREVVRYSSAPTGLVEYLSMAGNPVGL